jgi:hypothetical protein
MATPGSSVINVNGVNAPITVTTFTDDTIDLTVAEYSIGGTVGGSLYFPGDIYSAWMQSGVYYDFGSAEVRRKIYDADQNVLYPGTAGDLWTGTRPDLFLCFDTSSAWAVNKGSRGGTFTINGTAAAPGSAQLIHAKRDLFAGFIDDWKPDPSLSAIRNTYITARDAGKVLRHRTITTSLFTNYNAGSLFSEILTGAGVASFTVDTMQDVIPFAFYRDRNAQNAIDEMIQAGYSFAYIDGAGTFKVKKRYYEIEGSIVGSLSEFMALNYTLSDRAVYNYVTVEGEPRRAATSTQTLASLPTPFYIPASSAISFFLEYLDPANSEPVPGIEMVTPVSSTDYLTNAASNGGGANLTATTSVSAVFFAQTAYNTVFNGSATDAYLTKYTLRGKPVQRLSRFTALSEHTSSQNFYGTLAYALSNPLIGDQQFGQNYAGFILARNADPFPDLGCVIQNEFPLILSAEVSDQLHIVNTFSGINSAHVIQAMSHTIDLTRGLQHTAEYTIERYNDQGALSLDHPVYGLLDSRRLGF